MFGPLPEAGLPQMEGRAGAGPGGEEGISLLHLEARGAAKGQSIMDAHVAQAEEQRMCNTGGGSSILSMGTRPKGRAYLFNHFAGKEDVHDRAVRRCGESG